MIRSAYGDRAVSHERRLGFWDRLRRPIWALAPMEDVTDTVLRTLLRTWSHTYARRAGKVVPAAPAVMFTEFTRVDTPLRVLDGQPTGRLRFTEQERPIVAHLWGTRPEEFLRAAAALEELGFDGIDLNFGCPARKIRAAGACSAMIARPSLAAEIIAATREGASLPVSAKTRIGIDRPQTEQWCGFLLEQGLAALTVHGRTVAQLSEGWADGREIARVVRIRDTGGASTLVLGNGDVRSLAHARRLVDQTGVDGVMIGRGIFFDPLLFARDEVITSMATTGATSVSPVDAFAGFDPPRKNAWAALPLDERLGYLEDHIHAWIATWGDRRNWETLKKFFRNYLGGNADSSRSAESRSCPSTRGGSNGERRTLLAALYAARTGEEALRLIADARGTDAIPPRTNAPLTDASNDEPV